MKRVVKVIGLLAIIMVAILAINDAICLWLVRHSDGMSAAKVERFYNGCVDDEVIILGSSLARRGLIPLEIAPKCYNYGEDGSFFYEMAGFLAAATKMSMVKTIIYVVDPWGMSGNVGDVNRCDYVLAPKSRAIDPWKCVPGFRFFASFRSKINVYNESKRKSDEECIDGAVIRTMVRSDDEWKAIEIAAKKEAKNFRITKDGDEKLRMVINLLGNKQLLFVVPPGSPPWKEVYEGHDEMLAYLKSFECPQVGVIDLWNDEDFTRDDFFDQNHLNKNGALKFSKKVKEALKELAYAL